VEKGPLQGLFRCEQAIHNRVHHKSLWRIQYLLMELIKAQTLINRFVVSD